MIESVSLGTPGSAGFPSAPPELGLGLLSIGRTWGVAASRPPAEEVVPRLLDHAVRQGIRVFDTAPAYARSEAMLGVYLGAAPTDVRRSSIIMTKAGEFWSEGGGFVDHGYDALVASLETSLRLLGRIDVWQIHKSSETVVRSTSVAAAIGHARKIGVKFIGASVSDGFAARAAVASGLYDCLQFPYSALDRRMSTVFELCRAAGMFAIVNRPLGMGALAGRGARGAFSHVCTALDRGVILTGTANIEHLSENVAAFRAATVL